MWPLATWSDQSLCNGPGHIASSNDAYSPSPKPGLLSLLNQWRRPCSLDWRRAWSCEVSRVWWSTTSWGSDSGIFGGIFGNSCCGCEHSRWRGALRHYLFTFRPCAWSRPPKRALFRGPTFLYYNASQLGGLECVAPTTNIIISEYINVGDTC